MVAAADRDDDAPVSQENAALRATAEAHRIENERLQAKTAELTARIAELESVNALDPDLRPLRSLCASDAQYQRAIRAEGKKLQIVRLGDNLFTKPEWMALWRMITRQAPLE